MPLPDALLRALALLGVLAELTVPYLMAGSLASTYHGFPRSTAAALEITDLLDRALAASGME